MTYKITFGQYEFPMPQNINDNFLNFVPATDRIFGMDGGYDNYGQGDAPQEIGNVSISLILSTYDANTFQTTIDQLGQLAAYGKQELRKWPTGASATGFRFCLARFNNISIGENMEHGFEQYQRRVTINFQVDVPLWLRRPSNAAEWAYFAGLDNLVWNSGSQVWDGLMVNGIGIGGHTTSQVFGYAGSAPTPLTLTLTTGVTQTLYNPRIVLEYDGQPVYEVRWQGMLSAGESLIIDSKRRQVILLSTSRPPDGAYQNFWASSADWLVIRPTISSAGTIRIYCESSADRGAAYMTWLEAFYT